ncbi:uncharacterized protein DUF2788 [Rivihabitans pingtungensis]|jgi:uncharacterized membrane protein YwaF|uniref:Uncharacterized protein DUF2788 n=3 Tax=Rivihabitans pingtungensis TaxID=1054498 RepID=A0A318L9G2_9NEIS|nr:uncharacterized protein DUF2788 [Rivihabitans pingtungensis]
MLSLSIQYRFFHPRRAPMLEQNRMSEEQFTNISMAVLLTGLILFMGFIIWDLGKKSNAGRFGMFVLFLALGFGVTGFVFKELLVSYIIAK